MAFAAAIDDKKERPFFGPGGPSNGWWRGFSGRHKEIALRQPGILDGGRATTAHKSVVDKFFKQVEATMIKHSIFEPSRLFNIDETGFGEKESGKGAGHGVYRKGSKYPSQRATVSRDHTTVTLCIRADGKVLPPNILYKGGFPTTNFLEEGPDNATYGANESGYMTGDLFLKYLEKGVEPFLDCERPCILTMDNASAHITLHIAEFCKEKGIVLLLLPANTTQMLQPCDQVFQTLKHKMADLARTAGLIRPGANLNKKYFAPFLSHALPSVSKLTVQSAWEKTGLYPLNSGAIPAEKFVADHVTTQDSTETIELDMTVDEEPGEILRSNAATQVDFSSSAPPTSLTTAAATETVDCQTDTVTVCDTCTTWIRENPLVKAGKIPADLAQILIMPPQVKKSNIKPRVSAKGGIILTADDEIERMRQEEAEKQAQEKEKESRATERKSKKENKKKEMEQKKEEREKKKQQQKQKKERETELKKQKREEKNRQRMENKARSSCRECGGTSCRAHPTISCMFCGMIFHKKCVDFVDNMLVFICAECYQK